MNVVSSNYKNLINTSLSLSPKFKIIIDNVEYLSNVIKSYPKISHANTKFIGGFPSKTLDMEIYDLENNLDIENKEIVVYKGFVINDSIEYVKQGVFIAKADNITTNISTKSISLSNVQDRTQLLDDVYESDLNWSDGQTHTGLEIVQEICTKKGITLASNTFNFANYSFKQPNFTETITNREVLSRLAEIGGEIALFNCDGNLVIKSQLITGDTFQKNRYEKLSREKEYKINTIVLGKDGITDDIIYPKSISEDRIEFKILDNPFVDLYREEMVEKVASYIIGMSYIPYNLTNVVDGFIYELNDVVKIVDKNDETFNAIVLDISSASRIKSNIKADVFSTTTTDYNLAGSNSNKINQVKLEVDHQNKKITGVIESVETLEKEVTTTKETTGNNSLYIEDALESRVQEYGIDGKSEQEIRSGKNLLPIANTFGGSTTISGVTFTLNKDGTIKVNGTASAGISLYLFNDYIDLPSGTYTLSDSITSGVSGTTYFLFCDVKHKDGSAWDTKNMSTVSSEKTRTMGENFKAKVRIVIRSGQTLNNVVFKPQLEKNSVATEYEQYGVSPSPDYPSEIKSVEGIRNLFDLGTSLDDYFLTLIDGTKINTSLKVSDYVTATFTKNGISISNYNNSVYPWLSKIITLEKNTDYIISGIVSNGVKILGFPSLENGTIGTQISYIDNANLKPPKTFNSGNYAYYVISMYPPTNAYFEELQIEPGSIAHSYVPYGSWLKVQTTGKNIFDYANTNNWNTYGYYCNFELIDNGIRAIVNSESVLQYNYRTIRLDNINNLLGKTISISYEAKSSGANKPMVVLYWVKDFNLKTSIQNITTNNVVKIPNEIPSDANGLAILLYASGSGGTAVNGDYVDYTNIQIEYGTKTDYEPYKENITLIDMNKPNLFDKDNADILNLYPGTTFGSNTKYQSICIPIEPNTTYTLISLNHYSDGLTLGTSEEYPVVDGKTTNSLSVAKTKNNITITSGANDKYLLGYILWGTSISEEILNGIKIYKGVGIDDYYELCSINAKDNLKVSENGTTTIEKKIVEIALDGSETIKNVTGNNGAILHCISVPNCSRTSGTAIPNILSNKFIKQTRDNLYNGFADGICYGSVGSTYYYDIIIRSSELDSMSVDEFKTWLSENKPIIQYELAEPYTIDLGTIDISLFENINHINLLEDIETDTRVKYLINNVMNGTYATKGELELTNEQFQTTITNEFNSLERQMTSITQTGGAIDLAIQSSKNYTDSKNESLDNRITNSENNYNDLNNKYNTLYGKITDMNFSFKTDGLTIGTSGSEINSKLDNKGLKIYNASTLIAIFNQNGSGFKKLIATESIQLQNLLIQKRVINTPKANNMEVISFFFNKSLIENLTDLESD